MTETWATGEIDHHFILLFIDTVSADVTKKLPSFALSTKPIDSPIAIIHHERIKCVEYSKRPDLTVPPIPPLFQHCFHAPYIKLKQS